ERADPVRAAGLGLRFARLAAEAVDQFARAKREAGLLDFDDLITLARDLLRSGPPAVCEALREEVGVLLVDEFQDTDPLQAEVLDLLAGPGLCEGRLFLVGDTKQSIYRFRGARPHLFGHYRDRFPAEGRRQLTENFRSVPGVIAFVNALFADAFPGPEHRLEARSSGFAPGDRPAVHFLWAREPGAGKTSADEARRIEARWLARYVARRLGEGWPVWDEEKK